jgi:23S rRNA pseudoU1915 N3-methylase RlmH
MGPIQEAIAEIESREPGDKFSYHQIAKKYGVNRVTLARRHKGETEAYGIRKRFLHPQHETELVRYIDTLNERRTPPTRAIIQRYASSLAGFEVTEQWVSRFINRHPDHLISRYTKGMTRLRHSADSGSKYSLYFKLLHEKMEEYNVQPLHIEYMDEKGFKPPLIQKSFEVTGIYPPNPDVVLKKFAKEASGSDSGNSVLSGSDWLKLKSIVRREVKDQNSKDVKKLQRSLHHIAAQNTLLHDEIKGLKRSLLIKERQKKQSFALELNEDHEYHGGAVLWSPRSVQRARDRRASQQQQAELEKLQKAKQAEIKKAARDCKAQLKVVKRVERERRAEEKRKEEAEKLAKKQHRELINNTKKLIKLSQKGKRKASQPHPTATKRQKRGGVAPAVVGDTGCTSCHPTYSTATTDNALQKII